MSGENHHLEFEKIMVVGVYPLPRFSSDLELAFLEKRWGMEEQNHFDSMPLAVNKITS